MLTRLPTKQWLTLKLKFVDIWKHSFCQIISYPIPLLEKIEIWGPSLLYLITWYTSKSDWNYHPNAEIELPSSGSERLKIFQCKVGILQIFAGESNLFTLATLSTVTVGYGNLLRSVQVLHKHVLPKTGPPQHDYLWISHIKTTLLMLYPNSGVI